MKQLAAILLISVFTLSQYAKQLAYLECKFANSIQLTTKQCDCEKNYEVTSETAKKTTAPQSHFHPVIDDYYATALNNTSKNIRLIFEKKISHFDFTLCEGNQYAPDRPPQLNL